MGVNYKNSFFFFFLFFFIFYSDEWSLYGTFRNTKMLISLSF